MCYLDRSALSTGTGSLLWRAALDWLRAEGCSTVTVWVLETNERGIAFYERMGLTPDGATKTDTLRGFPLNELRYAGPIDA